MLLGVLVELGKRVEVGMLVCELSPDGALVGFGVSTSVSIARNAPFPRFSFREEHRLC